MLPGKRPITNSQLPINARMSNIKIQISFIFSNWTFLNFGIYWKFVIGNWKFPYFLFPEITSWATLLGTSS